MKYSFSFVVATSLFTTVAASGPSVAQTNTKSAPARQVRPNFEGVWSVATLTPLQRPKELEGTPYLTDEQAKDYVARRAAEVDFDRRGATAEADLQLPSINEFWAERGPLAFVDGRFQTSLIVDPPSGRLPPLTAQAQTRVASLFKARGQPSQATDYTASERCLLDPTLPTLNPSADGSLTRIIQTDEYVVMMREKAAPRVIPFDARPHVGASLTSWGGDSRGTWSGDTLVIDTTNFTSRLEDVFVNPVTPVDRNLHLVERLRRVDENTLRYEYTVTDPTAFTAPWTVVLPLRKSAEELYEVACHEGNYALRNMLSGAQVPELTK